MASTNNFCNAPAGTFLGNNYTSRTGQSQIRVQKDEALIKSGLDADTEYSDEQLATNDEEAIDINNIIGQFVRDGLKKPGACTTPGEKTDCP